MEQPKLNKDYINQSLVNQIASLSMQIAERDAIITEQHLEIGKLKKELQAEQILATPQEG